MVHMFLIVGEIRDKILERVATYLYHILRKIMGKEPILPNIPLWKKLPIKHILLNTYKVNLKSINI